MADMSNLLQNNLFLSMLSQGGASLAGEDSVAASINPILQGTIAAQSKAKDQKRQMSMLAKLLGQGVEFKSGADGKISIGAENLGSFLGDSDGSKTASGDPTSGGFGSTPSALNQQQGTQSIDTGFLSGLLNPNPSSLDVPAYSDLVGLTPQDMSNTLAGAVSVEKLKQAKIKDINDRIFVQSQAKQAQANINESNRFKQLGVDLGEEKFEAIKSDRAAGRELEKVRIGLDRGRLSISQANAATDKLYKEALTAKVNAETEKLSNSNTPLAPLNIPGIGKVSLDTWKTLPTDTKAYSYYAFDSKNRGEEVMPFNEWKQQTDEPTMKQVYDIAKEDEEFKDFYFKSKEASAIKIGDVADKAEQTGLGKGKASVQSPEFVQGVVEDLSNDRIKWNDPDPIKVKEIMDKTGATEEDAISLMQKESTLIEMNNRIKQVFKDAVFKRDGWYVDDKLKVRNPYVKQ